MARRPHHPGGDTAVDRLARQVAQELGGAPGFSRRSFLRASGFGALVLGSGGLLAACGTEGTQQSADSCTSEDLSDSEKKLIFSNWPLYMDEKGKRYPTLEDFQSETGIDVTYNTDVNGNNEFFAKVRNQLGACEPIDRDLMVLTDWMAARMVGLGWLQELDTDAMPNVSANLVESLRSPDWDPDRKHSVPWQSGLTGIAYNSKFTGKVSSFEELLTRGDLKGKVSLLNEMGDTMSFLLTMTGADPSDFSDDEWGAALERMEEAVASGQIRQFTGNDYTRPLNNGDVLACEAWSGDIIALQYDNPDIEFVVPEEGMVLWSDNMLVPNKAAHKANAEKLMDYYYEPEVAARLAAWVNYICPVQGAEEAMAEVDDSLVGNPLIFPTEEDLAGTFTFMSTDTKTREGFEKDFNRVIGA
ncbi:ABC transporter substrate-binding protein [Nocardioides donggukensis]|uniref:Spermidine/putrescine ABC transporter substrate-binding protein n=1 Tax=Nocardioides donggukensis TaxID=2774019 RepID=A0A927K4Z3_9ACTN|nr:spermidine/putrescine ABC transporter substrate-binding protein [Nocardioides donggukensis]MBD8869063.1 spermidine/putrescine ABC transporter substrate-binding protein [Nocardioides donggukensis]